MIDSLTPPYTISSVTSDDGTTFGYRQLGYGPGVIILHGGTQASQHYMRLAASLADAFTVYIPDRRGRGLSGPAGAGYGMAKECQDLSALLDKTGTQFVFGHSSGGLIALQAALTLPVIRKIALYEPPLSINGSVPTAWLPQYEREVARGKTARAMVTAIKGMQLLPERAGRVPKPLLVLLMKFFLWRDKRALQPDDVSREALVPTQRLDMQLVEEMASTLESFKALPAGVLLLGGEKSPGFLQNILDELTKVLPQVERVRFPDLDHLAPLDSAPERVGEELRRFFGKP